MIEYGFTVFASPKPVLQDGDEVILDFILHWSTRKGVYWSNDDLRQFGLESLNTDVSLPGF